MLLYTWLLDIVWICYDLLIELNIINGCSLNCSSMSLRTFSSSWLPKAKIKKRKQKRRPALRSLGLGGDDSKIWPRFSWDCDFVVEGFLSCSAQIRAFQHGRELRHSKHSTLQHSVATLAFARWMMCIHSVHCQWWCFGSEAELVVTWLVSEDRGFRK